MLPSEIKNKLEELPIPSRIEVKIYSIDFDKKRVVLSVCRKKYEERFPKAAAWERTIGKYKKGDKVKGIVTKEVNFGYFLKIDTGFEGLLHKSNIGRGKVPEFNEPLEVRIIKMDLEKKQIAFSY